ncbi:MAG: SPFH domain-containing protein [Salibacteraceae bacterium]
MATSQPTNRTFTQLAFGGLLIGALALTACGPKPQAPAPQQFALDQVSNNTLYEVRLGDGVPLDLRVSIRWKIEDYAAFSQQFASPHAYDSLILSPRGLELASKVSNTFKNVDSVFTSQRHTYVAAVKDYFLQNIGEESVSIKEVIVSNITFPDSYTTAREQSAMQERELERIRKESVVALERAKADKAQANSQGEVDMVRAQMNAKVEQINAETEKSRRKSELARAETQKQVSKLQAQAEAEKQELMAEVDLKKKRDLKALDLEDQKKKDQLAIEKQRGMDQLTFNNDMQMAKLCSENPVYASYMVNKELASKVQIAVLPSGQDATVFNGLLGNNMAKK